ncbi:MAG: GNAT family N-acetyltransferase, partial [Spirochaetaceae bacterium]|nr:GNAT family N-acetyltransferase [Spirochaetaceae bacterium]
DIELELIAETLSIWMERPGDPYVLLDLLDGKILAGFAIICKVSNTEYTYDLRLLSIDKAYKGKGVAQRLLAIIEEEILKTEQVAILRAEISRIKEDAVGRGLFASEGFSCIGHIVDFYEAGDDFFMFTKFLRRAET